jgi:hypothetical protein
MDGKVSLSAHREGCHSDALQESQRSGKLIMALEVRFKMLLSSKRSFLQSLAGLPLINNLLIVC